MVFCNGSIVDIAYLLQKYLDFLLKVCYTDCILLRLTTNYMSFENFPTFTPEQKKDINPEEASEGELESGNEEKVEENENNVHNKDENNESWLKKQSNKIKMGLAGLAVLSSSVEGKELENTAEEEFSKQDKDKKELYMDSSAEESAENPIGKVLNVEAENPDLELRTCSLHDLGFLNARELDKAFHRYYEEFKDNYPRMSVGDSKGRAEFAELQLAFINSILQEKNSGSSYIVSEKEMNDLKDAYEVWANKFPHIRPLVAVTQISRGEGNQETTIGVIESKKTKTGETEISQYHTNTFQGVGKDYIKNGQVSEDSGEIEFVIKVEKKAD